MRIRSLFYTLAVFFATPVAVFAHVKWFVEPAPEIVPHTIHLSNPRVLVWIGIVIAGIIVAYIIERSIHRPTRLFTFGQEHIRTIVQILSSLVGLWLIISAVQGSLIAPTYELSGMFGQILRGIELLCGVLLLFGLLVPVAAVLLLVVYIGTMTHIGFIEGLDHVEILGISAYLFLMTVPKRFGISYYQQWALPLLRFFAGLALIILAFSEKLLHLELASAFLASHPWNFMQLLGIRWFSDELFIISAGFTELLFGSLFILGLVTRINTIALAVFFLTTAVVLGFTEIIGHLPFFGMVLIFVLFGSGDKLKITPRA